MGNLKTTNLLDVKIKGVEGKSRAAVSIAKKADFKDVKVQLKSDATSSNTTGVHVGDDTVMENLTINMDF